MVKFFKTLKVGSESDSVYFTPIGQDQLQVSVTSTSGVPRTLSPSLISYVDTADYLAQWSGKVTPTHLAYIKNIKALSCVDGINSEVLLGDSGWRRVVVLSTLLPSLQGIDLRRVGNVVYCRFTPKEDYLTIPSERSKEHELIEVPEGYRTNATVCIPIISHVYGPIGHLEIRRNRMNVVIYKVDTEYQYCTLYGSWVSDDNFPSQPEGRLL